MKKPLSQDKILQIRNLVLTQGDKLTNKQMCEKLGVDLMPFAGVIAGLKRNKKIKPNFLKTEVEKNNPTKKRTISTIAPELKKVYPTIKTKISNKNNKLAIKTNKVASIPTIELNRELVDGIDNNNISLIRGVRFYSKSNFLNSFNRIKRTTLTSDSLIQLRTLARTLHPFKYIEII